MPRGAKKSAPQVVAPEPAGDYWEAELRWDRVDASPAASPPSPLRPSPAVAPASENLFPVAYDVKPVEAAQTLSDAPRDASMPRQPRATEAFCAAEKKLKTAKAHAAASSATLADFTALCEAEARDGEHMKAQFARELDAVLVHLEETEAAVEHGMAVATERFLVEQKSLLERIFDLISRDPEIEDAFNERVATLAECERVTDAYFTEHGIHVVRMAAMRQETSDTHRQMKEAMCAALQQTVAHLMAASVLPEAPSTATTTAGVEVSDAEPVSAAVTLDNCTDRRSLLGGELARVEGGMKRAPDPASMAALRRLVELEEQRLLMAQTRQEHLRQETEALLARTQEGRATADEASADHVPATALATSFGPTPPTGETINALADARRQLDGVTAELGIARETLRRVSQQHLEQLRGQSTTAALGTRHAVDTAANFLDPDTKAAVRATVVEAMAELDTALQSASRGSTAPSAGALDSFSRTSRGDGEGQSGRATAFASLLSAASLQDRKAIQNYVARRINRLFTCRHPSAPANFLSLE